MTLNSPALFEMAIIPWGVCISLPTLTTFLVAIGPGCFLELRIKISGSSFK